MIHCPNCGIIAKESINIYDERLKKQNIGILPILPTCSFCQAELELSHNSSAANIIILNGTCGSGKTTIAELLVDRGWLAIDGDCAIQSLRHKKGRKQYEWKELIDEIIYEVDALSLFSQHLVLSHIVLPEDVETYIELLETRNLKYKFILLKPQYHKAVERCQLRTCHTSTTPEEWIKHFHDILDFDDDLFDIIDNSDITAEETVDTILKLLE